MSFTICVISNFTSKVSINNIVLDATYDVTQMVDSTGSVVSCGLLKELV